MRCSCELVMGDGMPIQADRNRPLPARPCQNPGPPEAVFFGAPVSSRHAAESLSKTDTIAAENSLAFPPEHDSRVAAKACHKRLEGLKKNKGFGGEEELPGSVKVADRFVRAAPRRRSTVQVHTHPVRSFIPST